MTLSDPVHLPFIASEDYEAFRKLLKDDLPYAYDEWLKWHADRHKEYSGNRRVIDVDVKPDEFIRFCAAKSCGYNTGSLLAFAAYVAKRN